MSQQIMVQVKFTQDTQYGQYTDAVYYTQADYANIKQSDIDAVVSTRVGNYVNAIKNAPAPVQLTKSDIQAQIDALSSQVTDMQAQVVSLQAAKSVAPVGVSLGVADVSVGG